MIGPWEKTKKTKRDLYVKELSWGSRLSTHKAEKAQKEFEPSVIQLELMN